MAVSGLTLSAKFTSGNPCATGTASRNNGTVFFQSTTPTGNGSIPERLPNSPRIRTVTDQYLYNQMCSMLLEPQLSAGAWAGTNQFTLANLQYCLQKRTQEVIQAASCNLAQLSPIDATPGVNAGYALADTVLQPRRMRFLALVVDTTGTASSGASTVTLGSPQGVFEGQVIGGAGIQAGTFVTGIAGNVASISLPTSGALAGSEVQFFLPVTLTREDALAFQSFNPEY